MRGYVCFYLHVIEWRKKKRKKKEVREETHFLHSASFSGSAHVLEDNLRMCQRVTLLQLVLFICSRPC